MPLVGTFIGEYPMQALFHMSVGQVGYASVLEIILTRHALFMERIMYVMTEQEKDEQSGAYLKIIRIGSGLTQDDFIVDITALEDMNMPVVIRG